MHHKNILKIIKNIIVNLIIFVLVIIAIITIWTSIQLNVQQKEYADIFGYSIFSTETASMSPTMEIGDIVNIRIVDNLQIVVTNIKDDKYHDMYFNSIT